MMTAMNRIYLPFIFGLLFITLASAANEKIIYVDDDATGENNGTSWENAYCYLQDALANAKYGDEIRVAQGFYRPDCRSSHPHGTGDRSAAFELINGVKIIGGYAGLGTSNPNDRSYDSILHGCLGTENTSVTSLNELILYDSPQNNSYHVIKALNINDTSVLDGLFIMGGYANGEGIDHNGGGMYCQNSNLSLINCTFYLNYAVYGGGLFNDYSEPYIGGCLFQENSGVSVQENFEGGGGGIYNYNSNPFIEQCSYYWNETDGWGGGIFNHDCQPIIVSTHFIENSAHWGGGICNMGSDPAIWYCTFRGNRANAEGGGIQTEYGNPNLFNCIFTDNNAELYGGAIYHFLYGEAHGDNCTFIGNSAMWGGAIYAERRLGMTLSNCILWGNTALEGPQIAMVECVFLTLSHCCIQGGKENMFSQGHCSIDWDANSFDLNPKLTPDGHLQEGSPCIDTGNDELRGQDYVDMHGYPRFNNHIDIGAHEFYDGDGDGLQDWWERWYLDTLENIRPEDDPDSDTLTNYQEYGLYSSHPYRSPLRVPSNYPTIQAALDDTYKGSKGHTVLVSSGEYDGNLYFWNKPIVVLAPNGATINCNDSGRLFDPEYGKGNFAVLQGFSILSDKTDYGAGIHLKNSRFMLIDCSIEGNTTSFGVGGITCYLSNPTFCNLEIKPKSGFSDHPMTGYVEHSNVNLSGNLILTSGRLDVTSSWFYGEGGLCLTNDAILRITGQPESRPTIIRADITGPGNIEIDSGQQLIIEGDAVVNLGGIEGCNPDPNTGGHIIVKGALIVRGNASLESTNVDVKLFDVNTPNNIQYNNITLSEASIGFGGEFFVSGNATIKCNNIESEGDRYLDLDPDPDKPNRPIITENRISVLIKEGILGSQGTLLELRAKDYDAIGTSGAYRVSSDSPGFTSDPSENWVLDKLELQENSKLNLTNRQGFEYQDSNEIYPETVYVRELIIGPNSVLNTALQTLYYQDLILKNSNGYEIARNPDTTNTLINSAQFIDIPLLGFSLGIIAMDDQTRFPHNEFDIRVRKRVTDDDDDNPPPPSDPVYAGSIKRVAYDPNLQILKTAGGFMEMRTNAPGKWPAKSVAAKGAFARAGDEDITIEFEYMFRDDPYNEAELIVYLSDQPEVSKQLRQVARIRPPSQGRPGSVGSNQFAVFSGKFPKGDLNFTRGTYIELELRGRDVCCWVDNWDPRIVCSVTCRDYNGSTDVDMSDYLLIPAESGLKNPTSSNKGCLDLMTDGVVDLGDAIVWETYDRSDVLSKCPKAGNDDSGQQSRHAVNMYGTMASKQPVKSRDTVLSGSLVVLAKGGMEGEYVTSDSYLCGINLLQKQINSRQHNSFGRLVTDKEQNVYCIDPIKGLVWLDNDSEQVIVAPEQHIEYGNRKVTIGFFEPDDAIIYDAVFHPEDPNIVYMVPVRVITENNVSYKAAVKLDLDANKDGQRGDISILRLYGDNPDDISSIEAEDPLYIVHEPDYQHLREV
jgi:hypothetical protein